MTPVRCVICLHVKITTWCQNSTALLTSIYMRNSKDEIPQSQKNTLFPPVIFHNTLLYHCISICQDKLCMQSPARHIIKKKKRITSAFFELWNNKKTTLKYTMSCIIGWDQKSGSILLRTRQDGSFTVQTDEFSKPASSLIRAEPQRGKTYILHICFALLQRIYIVPRK